LHFVTVHRIKILRPTEYRSDDKGNPIRTSGPSVLNNLHIGSF